MRRLEDGEVYFCYSFANITFVMFHVEEFKILRSEIYLTYKAVDLFTKRM